MKKQLFFAVVATTIVLSFAACKKNKNDDPIVPSTLNSTKDFIAKYGAPKQTFTLNTSNLPDTITLAGNTTVIIPANAFTVSGTPVVGAITLDAIEVLKRSDVVFTGTNTNHISGMPLASDGFVFIDVKSNGVSVDRLLTVPLRVSIPTVREGQYTQLWVGDTDANETGQLGWAASVNGGADSVKGIDSNFTFDMRDLGWVNCDIFYAYTNPKTTLRIALVNNPGAIATFMAGSGETFVLFCAQGSNVVAQLYQPDGANQVKSYDNTMPIGVPGRLLSFCIKEGRFYFAKKDITISADMTETLTLAETTEAAIQAEIDALDEY